MWKMPDPARGHPTRAQALHAQALNLTAASMKVPPCRTANAVRAVVANLRCADWGCVLPDVAYTLSESPHQEVTHTGALGSGAT